MCMVMSALPFTNAAELSVEMSAFKRSRKSDYGEKKGGGGGSGGQN
jgi:hypothetical protein